MSKRILFVVAAIALLGAGLYYRSTNGQTAKTDANKVVQADAAGTDTTAPLATLKTFSGAHMGASNTVTLKASYDRADAAAKASASAAAGSNSQIYAAAQAACGGKSDSITQAHCNQTYLAQHLVSAPATPVVPAPVLATYQYTFKSPVWTPDLAGALFLGGAVALLFGLISGRRRRRGHL